MLRVSLVIALCLYAQVSTLSAGVVLYVDATAPPGGVGASWADAFDLLGDAIDAAPFAGATEIRVADGLYRPDLGEARILHSRTATFELHPGVRLLGGYAGLGAPDPDDRDPQTYMSILSGDLLGDDGANFTGRTDNSYHVLRATNSDALTTLDGFLIRGGYADGDFMTTDDYGGGLLVEGDEVTVHDCVFTDNWADRSGGALSAYPGRVSATECLFTGNGSQEGGAVSSVFGGSGAFTLCDFESNTAETNGAPNTVEGGAAYVRRADATFESCEFLNNVAGTMTPGFGGAVHVTDFSTCSLTLCQFTTNTCADGGSAISAMNSDITITQCDFTGNSDAGALGAIRGHISCTQRVVDCTFTDNVGGGIHVMSTCDLTVTGSTFDSNGVFGISIDTTSAATIDDCELFGHSTEIISGGATTITDCTLRDGLGLGLSMTAGSLICRDTDFLRCAGPDDGGGAYVDPGNNGFASFDNCQFIDNTAEDGGGVFCDDDTRAVFRNTSFIDNIASNAGGGAFVEDDARVVFVGCEIRDNMALGAGGGGGGGINASGGDLEIVRSTFDGNAAGDGGGISFGSTADTLIRHSVFVGNTATGGGGAIRDHRIGGATTIDNCMISGNTAAEGGALRHRGLSSLAMTGCSIAQNSASNVGGGLYFESASVFSHTCANSVLWGNTDSGASPQALVLLGDMDISWSCIQGGWFGAGSDNISTDPLFADADGADDIVGTIDDDLRLKVGSTSIDAGRASLLPGWCIVDLDTNERLVGVDLDQGAYEFGASPVSPPLYVDSDAPPGGAGDTWASPFQDLQHALDAALLFNTPTIEIRVGAGEYIPTVPGNWRFASFRLFRGTQLLGGYAGFGAGDPDLRDPSAFESLISGDRLGDDTPGFGNRTDNIGRLLDCWDVDASGLVDGVSLYGANGAGIGLSGNVALLHGGHLQMSNCLIAECLGGNGAVFNVALNGQVTLDDTKVSEVMSGSFGGSLALQGHAAAVVRNCSFIVSTTDDDGGAFNLTGDASVEATDCIFEACVADEGGAINLEDTAVAVFKRCLFLQNESLFLGGAIGVRDGSLVSAYNCRFLGNQCELEGGAVYIKRSNSGYPSRIYDMVNCEFSGNTAGDQGGAMYVDTGADTTSNHRIGLLKIDTCSFTNNSSPGAGALYVELQNLHVPVSSEPIISNSIFAFNDVEEIAYAPSSSPIVNDSCVLGGWAGAGGFNIFGGNPQFVDADGSDNIAGTLDDDLRLLMASSCVDGGNMAALPADVADLDDDLDIMETLPVDLDEAARVTGAEVDMGAYELTATPPCPGDIDGDGSVGSSDLAQLIGLWGSNNPDADLTGDGVVGSADLAQLIGLWGPCP